MVRFSDCPACQGDPTGGWVEGSTFSVESPCTTCRGTGERKIDNAALDLAVSAREWLEEYISAIFSDYANAFGFHAGYGVKRYDVGDDFLSIEQDTSRMNCSDSEHHRLPIKYFYANGNERRQLMEADAKAEAAKKAASALATKQSRLRELEEQAARLRNELR